MSSLPSLQSDTSTRLMPDDPHEPPAGYGLTGYNGAIDGLRAIAVVVVVLYHAGVLSGGWIGVEVFFVISGYLITSLLLTERQRSGSISVIDFWRRRARRLLPGLGVLVVMVCLYSVVYRSSRLNPNRRWELVGLITYSSNWVSISKSGYWAQFLDPSPLNHAWSLAVEEQFYLLFPLVCWLAWRSRIRRSIIPVALAFSLAWQLRSAQSFAIDRIYLGTDTRLFGLLAGATLAVWLQHRPTPPRAQHLAIQLTGTASLGFLVFAILRFGDATRNMFQGPFQLISIATVAVIFKVSGPVNGSFVYRLLGNRHLAYLGRLSYGIYLYHWPVLLVLEPKFTNHHHLLAAVNLALSVTLAGFSLRLIEQPIRIHGLTALRRKTVRWVIPVVLAVSMFLLVAISQPSAGPGTTSLALERRVPINEPTPVPLHIRSDHRIDRPTDRPLRLYVVGDSFGNSIYEAMTSISTDLDVELFSRAQGGCSFDKSGAQYFGGDFEPAFCQPLINTWRSDVVSYQPDAVIFSFGAWWGWTYEGSVQTQCDQALADHVRSLYDLALADLGATGAPVYFVSPANWDGPPVGPEGIPRFFDCLRSVLAGWVGQNQPNAVLIDVAGMLCRDNNCDATVNGNPVRPDGVHLGGPAALAATRDILAVITDPPLQADLSVYGIIQPGGT